MNDFFMWAGGFVVAGVFGVISWVLKMIFGNLKEHDKKLDMINKRLSEHKLHAAENFATKGDVEKGFDRVVEVLDSINAKLDTKADK